MEVIRTDRVCTSLALRAARQRVVVTSSWHAFFRILHLKDPGMSESQGNHKGEPMGTPIGLHGQEQFQDCFECKLSGTVIFAGVSVYLLNERRLIPSNTNINNNLSRRRFLLGMSVAFGLLSIARWNLRKIDVDGIRKKFDNIIK